MSAQSDKAADFSLRILFGKNWGETFSKEEENK